MRIWASLAVVLSLISGLAAAEPDAANEARVLRFPAIHGDQIVFTYAGDLYTVPANGGIARRLDQSRRLRDVRSLLAGRQTDRLHRPIRRQYRGLCHAGRGRRRRAGLPSPPRLPATTSPTAWGRTTSSSAGLRTANASSSARACDHSTTSSASFTRYPLPAACRSNCRCRAAVSAPIRPTARNWPTTASSASSAPGNAIAAAWPTTSGFTISRRKRPTTSPPDRDVSDPNEPAGVHPQNIIPMWSGDKIYFLSDRDALKRMNLYVQDVGEENGQTTTHFTDFDIKFPVARRQGHRL